MLNLGVFILASPLDAERKVWVSSTSEALRDVFRTLSVQLGFKVSFFDIVVSDKYSPPSEAIDGALIIVLSGGTDRRIYNIVSHLSKPSLIYAHPGENSLASVREAVAALKFEGYNVPVIYGDLRDLGSKVVPWLRALSAYYVLRRSKLGLVGEPEPWLLNVKSEHVLRERFGIEVVSLSWDDMLGRAYKIESDSVKAKALELSSLFGSVEVPYEDLEKALRVYFALKSMVSDYKLNALAVEARDMLVEELRDYGPYLAVSLLSSEGVPADYEVDVEPILTKLLIYALIGKSSFIANMSRIDESRGTLILSHCTVPIDMIDVRASKLTTYFETGRTVAVRGKLREGETVTIARIGGAKSDILMASRGIIVNGDVGDPNLCRTQVEVKVYGDPMKFIEDSIGNHVVMAYGDFMGELRLFSMLAGLKLLII